MDLYANRCGSQSGLAEARCRGRSAAKRCVERAGGGSRSTRTSIRGAACTPSPQNSAMPRPEHHPATFTHSLDGRMGTPERPRPRIRDLEPRCVEPPHHSRGSNAEANVLRLLEIWWRQRIPSTSIWFCSFAPKAEADAPTALAGTAGDRGIARRAAEGGGGGRRGRGRPLRRAESAPEGRCRDEIVVEGSRKSCAGRRTRQSY
jgi:hypothetical protein